MFIQKRKGYLFTKCFKFYFPKSKSISRHIEDLCLVKLKHRAKWLSTFSCDVQFLLQNVRSLGEEAALSYLPSSLLRQVPGRSFNNCWMDAVRQAVTIVLTGLSAQLTTSFRIMDLSTTVVQSTEILLYESFNYLS